MFDTREKYFIIYSEHQKSARAIVLPAQRAIRIVAVVKILKALTGLTGAKKVHNSLILNSYTRAKAHWRKLAGLFYFQPKEIKT